MIRRIFKVGVLALTTSGAVIATAQAGGFNRGTADTDILFEGGDFAVRSTVAVVMPQRAYATIAGAAGTDPNYTDTYAVPSMAFSMKLVDNVSCAGTYTQPFGGDATYGVQSIGAGIAADIADGNFVSPSGTAYSKFSTNEFGLTCGYKFTAGPGNLWILGGGFLESIRYEEASRIANATLGPIGTLKLADNNASGYRLGAAYEIPDIALRIQGMYRSEVTHNLTGTFDVNGAVLNPAAVGMGTFPQSFELKAQSGIAPGWLAFASVKWTDWSVFQQLNYTTTAAQTKDFFYKDGWTLTGGIAHRFNEKLAASASFTWDSGVSTTEDVSNDSYTLASGISLTDDHGGELRLGGALIYLTGGAVAQAATCNGAGADCGTGTGAKVATTVDGDWAYALSGSYKLKF